MSDLQIRQATEQDAVAIGMIMAVVWPDSPPQIERIQNVICNPAHATLLGLVGDTVAGFVDGFMTETTEGEARWEVDLLAVHPHYQRRGIASALIDVNTHAASEQGAIFARGLVAVANIGSERAFARCGYETDSTVHELLVAGESDKLPTSETVEVMPYLIQVETINYSGLWIEGQRTKAGLEKALSRLGVSKLDVAGAVVNEAEKVLISDALALGFEKIGRYQWWWRCLKP